MNTTEAICGHRIPACGEPGSAARRRGELSPCSACRMDESFGAWSVWFDRVADRVRELEEALRPLARVVPWLPDGKDDGVYIGTQIRGVDDDTTPTVGDCRRAASLLAPNGEGRAA